MMHMRLFCPRVLKSREEDDLPQKLRRAWTKDWVARRQEGLYAKLLVELRAEEPESYRNFLRMGSNEFDDLLALVTTHILEAERLVLTLRYLATGEHFRSMQYLFRIPVSTISSIIPGVLNTIYKLPVAKYIQTPRTPEAWDAVASKFNELWQFPNCIGAVDRKHVVMVAPPNAGSIFYNYKGTQHCFLPFP